MLEFLKRLLSVEDERDPEDIRNEMLDRVWQRIHELREANGDKERIPVPMEDPLARQIHGPELDRLDEIGNDISNYSGYCLLKHHDRCRSTCWCACHVEKVLDKINQADKNYSEKNGWCVLCDRPAHRDDDVFEGEGIYDPVTWTANLGPEGWTP